MNISVTWVNRRKHDTFFIEHLKSTEIMRSKNVFSAMSIMLVCILITVMVCACNKSEQAGMVGDTTVIATDSTSTNK